MPMIQVYCNLTCYLHTTCWADCMFLATSMQTVVNHSWFTRYESAYLACLSTLFLLWLVDNYWFFSGQLHLLQGFCSLQLHYNVVLTNWELQELQVLGDISDIHQQISKLYLPSCYLCRIQRWRGSTYSALYSTAVHPYSRMNDLWTCNSRPAVHSWCKNMVSVFMGMGHLR